MNKKKRNLSFLFSAAMICNLIFSASAPVYAAENSKTTGEIAIDETHFPDPGFRKLVEDTADLDKNGNLSDYEISKISNFAVMEDNVSSLKGIEYFSALTELICFKVPTLKSIDLTKNPNIVSLSFHNNPVLENIDITKNTKLKSFVCNNSPALKDIDLTKNTDLYTLSIPNTGLTKIDVSKNLALGELDCSDNQITSLDLSKNPMLIKLSCSNNQLTNIDLSKNFNLEILYISNNQLKELNLTKNPKITGLYVSNNEFLSLDLNKNSLMKTFTGHTQSRNIRVPAPSIGYDLTKSDANIDPKKISNLKGARLDGTKLYDYTEGTAVTYDYSTDYPSNSKFDVTLHLKIIPNTDPVILAEDKTLTVGDKFLPLDGVSATDQEDGTIAMTEANIKENNVDTSKAGTYQITYIVTDSQGASSTKTVTITVEEKTGQQNPDIADKPSDDKKPSNSSSTSNHITVHRPNNHTSAARTAGTQSIPETKDAAQAGLLGTFLLLSGTIVGMIVIYKKRRIKNYQ